MNNSDTEFTAEKQIFLAASTQDTSLTASEANLHVVSSDSLSMQKEKNKKEKLQNWTKKVIFIKQEEFHHVSEIKLNLNKTVSLIFSLATGLQGLLELIVEQLNLCAHHNGKNFTVVKEELKAFLGINFVMGINKLFTIAEYWRVDNLIDNDGI